MSSPELGPTLWSQGLRFVFFGTFNTLATYLAYCLLVFALHPQIAYAIIYVLGIALAYAGNSRFVFRKALNWRVAGVYPLVYLAQYALTAGLIHFFGAWLDLGPRLALALALLITTPVSFLMNRQLLSKAPNSPGVQ